MAAWLGLGEASAPEPSLYVWALRPDGRPQPDAMWPVDLGGTWLMWLALGPLTSARALAAQVRALGLPAEAVLAHACRGPTELLAWLLHLGAQGAQRAPCAILIDARDAPWVLAHACSPSALLRLRRAAGPPLIALTHGGAACWGRWSPRVRPWPAGVPFGAKPPLWGKT